MARFFPVLYLRHEANFMKMLLRKASLLLLLTVSLGLSGAIAQSTRGVVTGTVQDSTGALLADADVTLFSPSTGISSTLKTNKAGIYRFDAVLTGDYTVTASAAGFAKSKVA
jgi:protocatechuate 3,4-dioxygenase beta subunit